MVVIKKTMLFLTFLMVAVSGRAVFAASLSPDGDAFMIYESPLVVDSDEDLVLGSTYCRDVARAADGSFVVIWQSTYKYQGTFERVPDPVYAQRFTAEGSPLTPIITVTPEEPLETYAGVKPIISAPSVACNASGNFVVAWYHKHPKITHEDNTWEPGPIYIYARQFKADGTPWGEPINVSQPYDDAMGQIDVAMNDQGLFVVAWTGATYNIIEDYSILMRRFDSDGTSLDRKPIHVNTIDYKDILLSSNQEHPSVVIDNDGNIAIAWVQTFAYGWLMLFLENGHPYECRINQFIAIRFFNSRGRALGLPRTVWRKNNRITDGEYTKIHAPLLCMNPSGNVSVSWNVINEGVYSRFYTFGGSAQSDIIPVSTHDNARISGSVMDDNGNLAVLFRWSGGVYGQAVDADGMLTGSAIELVDLPTEYEWFSVTDLRLSSDSYENIVLVWRQRDPEKDGIMARNILFR